MPWTSTDHTRLKRACRQFKTDSEAAKALGVSRSGLCHYLAGRRKPRGLLVEATLRERIALILSGPVGSVDFSSMKQAGS